MDIEALRRALTAATDIWSRGSQWNDGSHAAKQALVIVEAIQPIVLSYIQHEPAQAQRRALADWLDAHACSGSTWSEKMHAAAEALRSDAFCTPTWKELYISPRERHEP